MTFASFCGRTALTHLPQNRRCISRDFSIVRDRLCRVQRDAARGALSGWHWLRWGGGGGGGPSCCVRVSSDHPAGPNASGPGGWRLFITADLLATRAGRRPKLVRAKLTNSNSARLCELLRSTTSYVQVRMLLVVADNGHQSTFYIDQPTTWQNTHDGLFQKVSFVGKILWRS